MNVARFQFLVASLIMTLFCSLSVTAAESEMVIPGVEFTGSATFETLNLDTYTPSTRSRFSQSRSGSLEDFKYTNPYPVQNYGYPSGASGVNLGGRTIDDTQVTTLGVPLNLPQGGGADFSSLPSFLWSEIVISPSTSSSGFSPSAASGRLEFIPWTRAQLIDSRQIKLNSRVTSSYDRDLQSYSLASVQKEIAVVAGVTQGKNQGIAGEFSYYLLKKSGSHVLLHGIGSSQNGASPGSASFPSPLAQKKVWRVIPVLESHQELGSGVILESTLFGDFQRLAYSDPAQGSFDSDTHTQQAGIENAVVLGANTLSLSGRLVKFQSNTFHSLTEWPLYSSITHDFYFSESTSLKASLNANYLNQVGLYPGAKLSAKFSNSEKIYPFAEISTLAKMPTLSARYYQVGIFYHGNPDLKPERVHALLAGYQFETSQIKSVSTLKLEYRNKIQVDAGKLIDDTTLNAGNAYLASFHQEVSYPLTDWLRLNSHSFFTYSKLTDSKNPYPDLPFFSEAAEAAWGLTDALHFTTGLKYTGPSTRSGGGFHAPYTLAEASSTYYFNRDFHVTAGVDNVFNSDGQAVFDYPLPLRLFFASLELGF